MTNELNFRAETYQKAHRKRMLRFRIFGVLAAVTVFITTYALILPAITKEPSPGIRLQDEFLYENEELKVSFTVEGRAVFENEDVAFEELSSEKVTLTVTPVEQTTALYGKYEAYAESNIGTDLRKLLVVRLAFDYEGEALDVSGCEISAVVTSKEELLQDAEGSEKTVDIKNLSSAGAEQTLALTAIQGVDDDLALQDTAYQTEKEGSITLNTSVANSSDVMALALYSTINPSYTVQYYSHVTVFDDDGDVSIQVIDTSGGKLPTNTKTQSMVDAHLNYDKTVGAYVMAMHLELAPLYASKTYEYVKAPGVAYVDRNRENGNFTLYQVWVLKAGKSASSVKESDWTIYPADVSFTNRAASATAKRIYIEEGAVIRLVYNEVEGDYTSGVLFYDYDISNGYIYGPSDFTNRINTSAQTNGTWYTKTANYGINSFTAKAGTVKLAFGNVNAGTNYGTVTWTDPKGVVTTPNMYNSVATLGCTFGLVTGMNADGTLKYAKGISAPVLFGHEQATGKTILPGYNLQFERTGDTYVLTAIGGTTTKNLQYFTNPSPYDGKVYTHIYTNNFWPMDSSPTFGANGHDLKFGNHNLKNNRKFGATTNSFFPESDDGKDHNSYFGMNYEVQFELTEDYLGHLEYIFYGDDDMWVFLDGQLVCDIGGVHSSVGQYVNLWDYINKMPDEQKYGKHTLSFYYTERGASGSTCYMQFTLPSVSIDTPQVESNTLEVGKTVENANTDMQFEFTIELLDQSGALLIDDYSYTLHDSDGTALSTAIINSEEQTVLLKNGQYIEINYLPEGARYRITERVYEGFHTTYRINDGSSVESYTAQGQLTQDTRVQFTNSTGMKLPSTGGIGLYVFSIPFLLAIAAGVIPPVLAKRVKGKRRAKT